MCWEYRREVACKLCVTVFHHISDVDRGVNFYDM